MRVLVEQTHEGIATWLNQLGLENEVNLHVLMGGEDRRDSGWRLTPERDAIIVGTIDMVISRALNRGYGESRWSWPIDFGLFNNGCHFIFDEVQLMGPALPTSRQLSGLRRALGTAAPCSSTWMSATVDPDALRTVDAPDLGAEIGLGESDRTGPLALRLNAPKRIEQVTLQNEQYAVSVATEISQRHRPGTLTIALFNTVERAVEVHHRLLASQVEAVLVHSRFRPGDRAARVQAAIANDIPAAGRVVVSTQVLEAGVDISATTLFTEAAPWSSIVQRTGRCNRDGLAEDAIVLWARPPRSAPYEETDIANATTQLEAMEGMVVSPSLMLNADVAELRPMLPVLRRRDLLELFDTTPNLSGDDIDIARFIRESEDLDVDIAWRELPDDGAWKRTAPIPSRDERCPVSVMAVRAFIGKGPSSEGDESSAVDSKGSSRRVIYRYDHLDEAWVVCQSADIKPGLTLLVNRNAGGYLPEVGWAPTSKAPVPPVAEDPSLLPLTAGDQATGDNPITFTPRRWQALVEHLEEVEGEVRTLAADLPHPGLSATHVEAAAVAGRHHDVGKAHFSFQEMLRRSADGDPTHLKERDAVDQPWAKSGGEKRVWNIERPHFRHELGSVLALLDAGSSALDGVEEANLALYLVASHHGRIRLGARSLPDEGAGRMLGIEDGEVLPEVVVPNGLIPASTLRLAHMGLGAPDGLSSWTRRMLELRDRDDLGPFRLGFLEALVRLADWRVSARGRSS